MKLKSGKVFLVGAGPGNPGLITIKAMRLLQRADVIIYDQLVSYHILSYANPSCEKIFVGKTGKKHYAEQDDINLLLVKKARQGKIVVRLKGGDPFVFGRGGEEADFLQSKGIEFEVVPGITSAIAVPAYAGIPVTHRGVSSSFAVITGHEDPRKKTSSINWTALSAGADTLIFLMGMQNLAEIAGQLIKSGKKPETPVAVVKDGTLPVQVIVEGTLQNISERVKKKGVVAPAVIVIGNVVKLSKKFNWFKRLPLSGKRVMVTRAGIQSANFEEKLFEHGAMPVHFPMIEIKPVSRNDKLDAAISKIASYDWIIFTSVNGVEIFFQHLAKLSLDSRALANVFVGAIGPATGKMLETHGILPDYIPTVYTGTALVNGLKSRSMKGKRVLIPRADIADDEITLGLSLLKAKVEEIKVYRTVRPNYDVNELKKLVFNGGIDIITFTSSSTVTNFIIGLSGDDIARITSKIACIGPKTAKTAKEAGLKVDIVARKQTLDGLLQAMENYYREDN